MVMPRKRAGLALGCTFPHSFDTFFGEGVFLMKRGGSSAESGLVDEVAEGALQVQGFGGEGARGFDGAGVLVPQRGKLSWVRRWQGAGLWLSGRLAGGIIRP